MGGSGHHFRPLNKGMPCTSAHCCPDGCSVCTSEQLQTPRSILLRAAAAAAAPLKSVFPSTEFVGIAELASTPQKQQIWTASDVFCPAICTDTSGILGTRQCLHQRQDQAHQATHRTVLPLKRQ